MPLKRCRWSLFFLDDAVTYAHGARRLRMLGMCVWSEREFGVVSDTLFLTH